MTNLIRFLGGLLALAHFCSCATAPVLAPEQAKAAARREIVVVEEEEDKFHITSVGTTAFNNSHEQPEVAGLSFADYLVGRLKAKGYAARKSATPGAGLSLNVSAWYPYKAEHMRGLGLARRGIFGLPAPFVAHCIFNGSLSDKATGAATPHIWFRQEKYVMKASSVKRDVAKWADFTPAEQAELRALVQDQMRQQADFILADLGL
jgi:hypothetical protein